MRPTTDRAWIDAQTLRPVLTRRSLIVGIASLTGGCALASCSSESHSTTTAAPEQGTGAVPPTSSLFTIFDRNEFARAGVPQRLAFAVAGPDGSPSKEAPTAIDLRISFGGQPVSGPIRVDRHSDGVPIAYFPLRFTPESIGTYTVSTTIGGSEASASFRVGSESQIKVPQVGDKMLSVETPTDADHRGVDPICTLQPSQCGLHGSSLDTALRANRPVALLVSSPALCQIGVCGPVLDILVEQAAKTPDVLAIHAEVYTDRSAARTTPAVAAYHLNYEPALFVVGADGTVIERLDNVFDRAEVSAALTSSLHR